MRKNKSTINFTYPCRKCTGKSSFSNFSFSSSFYLLDPLRDKTRDDEDVNEGPDMKPHPAEAFIANRLPRIGRQEVASVTAIVVFVMVVVIGQSILNALSPLGTATRCLHHSQSYCPHCPYPCLLNAIIFFAIVDRDNIWVRDYDTERDDNNRVYDMIFEEDF